MKRIDSIYSVKGHKRPLYFGLSGVRLPGNPRWILMGGPDPDMIKMINLLEAKHIKVRGEIE